MAEERGNAISAFPDPPLHWKSFTSDNLAALQSHLESHRAGAVSIPFNPLSPRTGAIPDESSLPSELQALIPPPIPPGGAYRSFNTIHNVAAPHPSQLPTPPSPDELLGILKRILLKLLRITHILAIDPDNKYYAHTWDELEALFKQMHTGINAWRPHQGREMLIQMMEAQIKGLKEETERCNTAVQKAKDVLEGLGNLEQGEQKPINGFASGREEDHAHSPSKRMAREKRIWEVIGALDSDLG